MWMHARRASSRKADVSEAAPINSSAQVFQIEFTPEAIDDLRALRKYDQQMVMTAIETHLRHEPIRSHRNRKQLRPNLLAEWELRVGGFRVFYDFDVHNALVKIVAVGYKRGKQLFVHGEEYEL
jgi:mRNA-degrading endonuclease RelE of RelBE toxin-antitoxin system